MSFSAFRTERAHIGIQGKGLSEFASALAHRVQTGGVAAIGCSVTATGVETVCCQHRGHFDAREGRIVAVVDKSAKVSRAYQ